MVDKLSLLLEFINIFAGVVAFVLAAVVLRCLTICFKFLPKRLTMAIKAVERALWFMAIFMPLAIAHFYIATFKLMWYIYTAYGIVGLMMLSSCVKIWMNSRLVTSSQKRVGSTLLRAQLREPVSYVTAKTQQISITSSFLKMSPVILQ